MSNKYNKGQSVRLTGTFTASDIAADPDAVVLSVMDPEGTKTTYQYSEDELTKASTGIYYADVIAGIEGIYKYGFVGTGAVDTSNFTEFEIMPWPFS